LPDDQSVSAVFLIAVRDDCILAVRNERGWDIPGGHVEVGETPLSALSREIMEEAAATFVWAEPFAVLRRRQRPDVMLFFTTSAFELSVFGPKPDALDRALLSPEDLLKLYNGPADVLQLLIRSARDRL
jgi:8-oxo-dGTP pyrophosphatase MutT (NUDIX family)